MKKIKIYNTNKAALEQLAIGAFGSNELPKGFIKAIDSLDIDFFIRWATPTNVKVSKDGRSYRKCDAIKVANTLHTWMYAGELISKEPQRCVLLTKIK